ncbi:MAG: sugar dehydrogenase [Verrucomicrobia bacterium]|nr:MAG: sugar dehydrogenase [Verrucomicrobiota bacterium]
MKQDLLQDQVAVVTGASSGIGAAIARRMAHAGAAVAVNYSRDVEGAQAVVGAIKKLDGEAIAIQADVSDEAQVKRMFEQSLKAFGTVDILVNNAGIQQDCALVDMTVAQWQRVIDVNLTGQFLCSREAVREFLRQGLRLEVSLAAGKIICISSVHQVIAWAGHVNYTASKGGIDMLMQSMAQELAPKKIRVNSIAPGAIKTHINRAAWQTPEAAARLLKLIPYGRIGVPEDVAKAAVWLACDDSDYITGATLYVDGGMTLYPAFSSGG